MADAMTLDLFADSAAVGEKPYTVEITESVTKGLPTYKYTMSRWRGSSHKFGVCEVCGEFVDAVHHQVEYQLFDTVYEDDEQFVKDDPYYQNGNSWVGHKDCLMAQRKAAPMAAE